MEKVIILVAAVLAVSSLTSCIIEAAPAGTGFEVAVDFGARSVTDDANVSSVRVQAYDQDNNLLDEDTLTEQPWKASITIDPSDYGSVLFIAEALGSGSSVPYSGELLLTIGAETARSLTITVSVRDYISSNIGTLKYVPAGSFQRNATATNVSVITQPYRMSQYEITREQFVAIMGTDPSSDYRSSGALNPVQMTTWYHAIAFCNKLSLAEDLSPVYSIIIAGTPIDWTDFTYDSIPIENNADWNAATNLVDATGYRLPTEMEWMWAAMGADKDSRPGAMQDGINRTGYSKPFAGSNGSNVIGDYAVFGCYGSEAGSTETERTDPVGSKTNGYNELGLYDMSGNVREWCWDWYAAYPAGIQTDYQGPGLGSFRVGHGGSWYNYASDCTVAYRYQSDPFYQGAYIGIRVVRP